MLTQRLGREREKNNKKLLRWHNKKRRVGVFFANRMPMENIDTNFISDFKADDERLMHSMVICEDADLFYIDCYLQELFRCES